MPDESPVLIAGFGSFGATVGRLLRANGIRTTVLDHDSYRVDLLRAMGLTVYYGDATPHDLLRAAGAGHARLMVIALDNPEKTLALVHTARNERLTARADVYVLDQHALLASGLQLQERQAASLIDVHHSR